MADFVKTLVGVTILAAVPVSYVCSAEFDIKGLTKPLEENLEYYLTPLANVPVTKISKNKISKLVSHALNPYGYYHPMLSISLKDDKKVVLEVEPGPVTVIATSEIVVTGDARLDRDFIQLVENAQLKSGQPLSHQNYDALKQNLLSLAQQKGYLDGQFLQSTLEVIPSLNVANVKLHFDSGSRYRFGDILVVKSRIEMDRIESLRTFEAGEEFNTVKLAKFQSNLSETNWFKSVAVTGDFDNIGEDNQVPIEVSTQEHSRNIVQVGGGYETDLGLRGSLKWTKPWYNSRGHSLKAEASVSKPEQSLLMGYKIPMQNVLTDYYGIQFESKHIDYRDTTSFTNELTFEKHWQLDNYWQSTMHVRYLLEKYQQASENNTTQLLLPGVTFSMLERKNELLEIKHRHVYTLEYSEPYLLSDLRLLHLEGNSVLSWDISKKHKFHFRSRVGANIAESLSEIPSSLRFFAGGDENLRGYGYESISPQNDNGELTGASYMFTTSFEYQYQVFQKVWLGAFYDFGDAFNDQIDWKRGTGLSLIWDSKYIPVKIDFAHGLDAPEGDKFRVHFSLGTQF